jgi:hypothetical protein
MKIRKTVSDAVIRANRENGKKSHGPKTKDGKNHTSGNATKHRILARKFPFSSDREQAAYRRLLERVLKSIDSKDALQRIVAEELVIANIRRARALKFEQKICERPNPASEVALNTIKGSELLSDGIGLNFDPQWDCKELNISAKKSHDGLTKRGTLSSGNGDGRELRVHVKFQDPMDKAQRYQRATGRDLYRALEVLCRLRGEKKHKSKHLSSAPIPQMW